MKCLYCLKSDKAVTFNSKEHVVPAGLGNQEIILEKGIVCDTCNNEVLSGLDSYLADFDPIKFMRSYYGVKTRKGEPVNYKNVAFEMIQKSPGELYIDASVSKGKSFNFNQDSFSFNMRSNKKMTKKNVKLLARSLYKIALGIIYIDLGKEVAYSSRFDEVREIILGNRDFDGYLLLVKKPVLEQKAIVRHVSKPEMIPFSMFRFYFYGVDFIFDIENRKLSAWGDFPLDDYSVVEF